MGKRLDRHHQHQQRFYWQKALGTIVLTLGAAVSFGSSAEAVEPVRGSFEVAQVGVRNRIQPPTPLNLTPRTHIPLPKSNAHRHHDRGGYYPYSSYPDADYHRPRRSRSRRERSRRDRHSHHHRHPEGYNHHSHRKGDRRSRPRVIIINPGGQSRYDNYRSNNSRSSNSRIYRSGSYIRVIGR